MAVLALTHEEIPPHLHLRTLNPHVDWSVLPFQVPAAPLAWPRGGRRRVAGVSSFGFSGTNAHVVLEEAPSRPAEPPSGRDRAVHLVTLSALTESALREGASRLAGKLEADPDLRPADIAHTLARGRARLPHRLAVVAGSTGPAAAALADFGAGMPAPVVISGVAPARVPEVAFLFPGQGPQYPGMGRELYETEAAFRAALDRCDAALRTELERPLLEVMFARDDESAALLDQTVYTQPALFALEYALVELLRELGIVPSALIGHSLGEYVAACVAGVLSLDDALALVAERGRLMQSLSGRGAMAAINLPEERALEAIRPRGHALWVAAVNGPESVVISGEAWAVEQTVDELAGRGVRVQRLRIAASSHSPLVEPILGALVRRAASLTHTDPRVELVSNIDGAPIPAGTDWPAYWQRHMREPVRFADGMGTLAREGYRVFVEIAPHPTLLSQGQDCVRDPAVAWVPTLRKGRPDWESLLEGLGLLFARGVPFDGAALDRDRRRSRPALPTYPFERERYWFEGAAPAEGEPVWPAVERALDAQSKQGPLDFAASSFPAKWALLERLTSAYEVRALRQLGLFAEAGERRTPAEAVARSGVKPTYVILLRRWLEKLAAEGRLRADGEAFVADRPLAEEAFEATLEEAAAAFADYPELLAYVRGCGDKLAAVLTGRESPLETLFPGGSFAIADGIYQDSCVARYLNGLVRAAFEAVVRARPSGRLRVLEIGGGTAGTSSWVVPALPARRSSYLFTDVSDLFLGRAAEKLGAHAFVTYALFDVEKDPASQGLRAASFDLILAANVLHATRDLRATVARVRSLLAPGGLVVLSETTSHPHYFDISTGLIEGWQSFADDLRTDNPLVSAATWVSLLREAGLAEAAAFPADDNPASILGTTSVGLAPGMSRAGASPRWSRAFRRGRGGAAAPEPALQELLAGPSGERISSAHGHRPGASWRSAWLDATRAPDADRGLIDLGLDR
jgi:malonyl CoA-acyl carrier protein transacylase/SAM-dependent methyltransferase